MNFLDIIHELLTSYQRLQWPGEPDEKVARVVLAVERELQNKEKPHEENHRSDYYFSFID